MGCLGCFFAYDAHLFYKKHDEQQVEKLPEETQRKIQQRQDNIEFAGCLIGGGLALIITLVMLYMAFFEE